MIKYKSGYKYQLVEEYTCQVNIFPEHDIITDYILLAKTGILTIKKGYAWDGPSGPTFDTKTFMRGSLVHDALYQLLREMHLPKHYRANADQILHIICIEDGMNRLRAWYVYKGVEKGAGFAADPKHAKPILTAPQGGRDEYQQ